MAFAKALRKDDYIISFEEEIRAEGENLLRVAAGRREDMYGTFRNMTSAPESLRSTAKA